MGITRKSIRENLILKFDITNSLAREFVDSVFDELNRSILRAESVKISGLGRFIVKDKRARIGRNPKTKEPKIVSARKVLLFKPSITLNDLINNKVIKNV